MLKRLGKREENYDQREDSISGNAINTRRVNPVGRENCGDYRRRQWYGPINCTPVSD
jgi:hypothetical protein